MANLAGIPVPRDALPPGQKEPVVKESLDWLRNNNPNPEDVSEPTLKSIADLAGVPMPRKSLPPDTKKQILDDSVNWLRDNKPKPKNVDDPTVRALANLAGVFLSHPVTDGHYKIGANILLDPVHETFKGI